MLSLPVLPALLLQPGAADTQTEQAYNAIKRRIIELDLPPGSQFTEPQLAAVSGTSKTPVREALARLQRDGLVEAMPRSGYRVAPITLQDTRDICALYRLLMSEAVELAARQGLPPGEIARLSELLRVSELLEQDYEGSDPRAAEDFLKAAFEFDAIIGNGTRNARLAAAITRTMDDFERILRVVLGELPWPDLTAKKHAVLDGITGLRPPAARSAQLARAKFSEREIINVLVSSSPLANVHLAIASPAAS
jgi:DNA-binding GntR family transcriptional regulator